MDLPPVGKRRLAGHRQRHERVSAKPKLSALTADTKSLDPLLRPGARHPQDQAVAGVVVAGRRDLAHERRREHVVAPLAVRIRLSVPPVVLDAEFRGASPHVSPLRNRTLPDGTTPYRNRHSAPTACFIGKRRAEMLDWDGGQGRNRTTDTRIFSPLLYQLSYLAGCGSRARTSGGGVLNRPRAEGSSNDGQREQAAPRRRLGRHGCARRSGSSTATAARPIRIAGGERSGWIVDSTGEDGRSA